MILIVLPLMAAFLVASVAAQNYNCFGGGMMSGFYGSYGIGMMILAWILYALFIVLVGAGIYWLIKSANKHKSK